MDRSEGINRKAVTVGFMLGGILIGIAVKVLLDSAVAIATGPLGRFISQDWFRHGIPVLAAFGVFISLQSQSSVRLWGDEVVAELRKVVWPSQQDTFRMTFVVCVMLVLAGIFLGILDVFSGKIVEWLLTMNLFGLIS